MKCLKLCSLMLLSTLLLPFASHAEVVTLGTANLYAGNGTVRYQPVAATQFLDDVMIQVIGASANISYFKVQFCDNEVQQIGVRQFFSEGSSSNWKPLDGGNRCIKGFYIGGLPINARAASVVLLGQRNRAPTGPLNLGGINLNFFTGAIRFADVRNVCHLNQVILRVTGDGAHIEYLAVRLGDGEIIHFDVRDWFAPGSNSRWLDLPLGNRCVDGFYIAGQTGFPFSPMAHVEFYAR